MNMRLSIPGILLAFLSVQSPPRAHAEPLGESYESSYTVEQLESLLGPLALHPDALVALILPAATVPTDIVLAARYLRSGGNEDRLDAQGWDESVASLARYPEIITWMDEDLPWTVSLGEAFMVEPAAVMNTIQLLRRRASAAGTLSSTTQQNIVVENEIISIVPTSTRVIYVPTYDPIVVYSSYNTIRPSLRFSFGPGRPIGTWLNYDCDWWGSRIWYRDAGFRSHADWDRRRVHFRALRNEIPGAHAWIPRDGGSRWRALEPRDAPSPGSLRRIDDRLHQPRFREDDRREDLNRGRSSARIGSQSDVLPRTRAEQPRVTPPRGEEESGIRTRRTQTLNIHRTPAAQPRSTPRGEEESGTRIRRSNTEVRATPAKPRAPQYTPRTVAPMPAQPPPSAPSVTPAYNPAPPHIPSYTPPSTPAPPSHDRGRSGGRRHEP